MALIDSEKRPANVPVPVLLAARAGAAELPSYLALRAAFAPGQAWSADLEVVEAFSLETVADELRKRPFAAVVFDAPSVEAIRAALVVADDAAARHADSPLSLILVTSSAADVAQLAEAHPHLVIDVLEPALAPLLARLKVSACAAFFRAHLLLRERLETAKRAAEEHLATVSHDLRNPLNTVILAAQRIDLAAEDSTAEPVIRKSVATISRAVDRMSRLVGDLLDLARLDAGQSLPLEWEDVDLAEQVRQAAEMIEPLATARRISVEVVATGVVRTFCDPERVQQVLANLLGNAVKFTREGGAITLRLDREPEGSDGRATPRHVVISVADTGIGIPCDQLSQIFTAYWQHDARRKRGAGLGLAIAKAIADTHGGSLDVESTEGVGSTFFFRLPFRAAAEASSPEIR